MFRHLCILWIYGLLVAALCSPALLHAQASAASPAVQLQTPAQPSIDKAIAVLDRYMDAVNRLDIEGIAEEYHFPHFRVVGKDLVIWETPLEALPMLSLPEEARRKAMENGLGEGWYRTLWGSRAVVHADEEKVHVATELIRQREDGSVINRFNSFYVVTFDGGRWAIKGRSSYAPR